MGGGDKRRRSGDAPLLALKKKLNIRGTTKLLSTNSNCNCCMTCYEDLPHEVRALIWEYRTEAAIRKVRKDATIIIFRNLARNAIAKRLQLYLELNCFASYVDVGVRYYTV